MQVLKNVVGVFSFLILAACQTSAREVRKPEPLVPVDGKPLKVSILGATYKIPKELSVDDHYIKPGRFVLDFTNKVTGCEGYSLFKTTGDVQLHQDELKEITQKTERQFQSSGVNIKSATENVSMGPTTLRVTRLTLSNEGDTAGAALLDAHSKDSQLSLIGYVFCNDLSVLPKSINSMTAMYSSRVPEKADD